MPSPLEKVLAQIDKTDNDDQLQKTGNIPSLLKCFIAKQGNESPTFRELVELKDVETLRAVVANVHTHPEKWREGVYVRVKRPDGSFWDLLTTFRAFLKRRVLSEIGSELGISRCESLFYDPPQLVSDDIEPEFKDGNGRTSDDSVCELLPQDIGIYKGQMQVFPATSETEKTQGDEMRIPVPMARLPGNFYPAPEIIVALPTDRPHKGTLQPCESSLFINEKTEEKEIVKMVCWKDQRGDYIQFPAFMENFGFSPLLSTTLIYTLDEARRKKIFNDPPKKNGCYEIELNADRFHRLRGTRDKKESRRILLANLNFLSRCSFVRIEEGNERTYAYMPEYHAVRDGFVVLLGPTFSQKLYDHAQAQHNLFLPQGIYQINTSQYRLALPMAVWFAGHYSRFLKEYANKTKIPHPIEIQTLLNNIPRSFQPISERPKTQLQHWKKFFFDPVIKNALVLVQYGIWNGYGIYDGNGLSSTKPTGLDDFLKKRIGVDPVTYDETKNGPVEVDQKKYFDGFKRWPGLDGFYKAGQLYWENR